MTKALVGLGWDPCSTDGAAFDLDASIFLLGPSGRVGGDADFVFYNNLKHVSGLVTHQGDNRTGEGDGDGEKVLVERPTVPGVIDKIVFAVTIHEVQSRRQNFGQVGKVFIRIVDAATKGEVARYDLAEDASTETAMIFGELYRNGPEWKFRAVGQGYAGGFAAMCQQFGVNAG